MHWGSQRCYFMSLAKYIKCKHQFSVTQSSFTALKRLCAQLIHLTPHPPSLFLIYTATFGVPMYYSLSLYLCSLDEIASNFTFHNFYCFVSLSFSWASFYFINYGYYIASDSFFHLFFQFSFSHPS